MPESPKFLILNQEKDDLGREGLEKLRDSKEEVEQEFDQIVQTRNENSEAATEHISVLQLLVRI